MIVSYFDDPTRSRAYRMYFIGRNFLETERGS